MKKICLAKKSFENKTGTKDSYKPIKIKKEIDNLKNMKLGNRFYFYFFT